MAFALPRISLNLAWNIVIKGAAIAGQFRQHYREPYDLRRWQRDGNRCRMHFPRAGRYLRAAIGAIDFMFITPNWSRCRVYDVQ